jgi:GTPase SAR1 family protein
LVFVVGNKNDLYGEEQIKKEDAEKYAKSINATYRCVSALEGKGIDELFDCVARSFFKREEKGEEEEEEDRDIMANKNTKDDKSKNGEFSLEKSNNVKKKKKKCC